MDTPTPAEPTPRGDITDQVRRGGQGALASVFSQNRTWLRRLVQHRIDRRVAGRVDASDVLQDAYLDAARQLDAYIARPPMSFLDWLRFLVRQRLMAVHRWHLGAQKRDPRQEASLLSKPTQSWSSPISSLVAAVTSPSGAAARREQRGQMSGILAQLEPADREILRLRHFQELSNQQSADVLGITPAAASKRYVRALERLRNIAGPIADK